MMTQYADISFDATRRGYTARIPGTQRKDVVQVDGSSYGISGIFCEWGECIRKNDVPRMDTLLVNYMTIIRNVYDKTRSAKEIAEAARYDAQVLCVEFNNLTKYMKNIQQPTIVFYFPSYHMIPLDYLRAISPQEQKLADFTKIFIKSAYPNKSYQFQHDGIHIHYVKVGTKQFPHIELMEEVNKIQAATANLKTRHYGMISHYVLDYHLMSRVYDRSVMLSSHTGDIWTMKTIGKKIFKLDYVPFNSATHVLFGDSTLLKPQVAHKLKKQILEIAEKKNWLSRTKAEIVSDINKVMPGNLITKINL